MKTRQIQESNFSKLQNFQINQPQFIKGGGLWSGSLGVDNNDSKVEEKKP